MNCRSLLGFFAFAIVALLATNCVVGQEPAAPDKIDFDRDIRPILSEHCFACHGPDENKLKAGLRLDRRESAFTARDSGEIPVVAGKLTESQLILRIRAVDPNEIMPPPDEGKPLTGTQIALVSRWVEQGAEWTDHWSLEKIRTPPIPVADPATGKTANPIDAFVLSKLKSAGLSQSPREDRERLIRRVSLDLTGLPPSIQEVDNFLADQSDFAFETVVDRLLKSPHFGERLALPWLDLARYGDTSGYHNDSLRDMWLWREWVIHAFNSNMPFDQFTIEQLAGDLIPNASIQQQVASGFHRNVMTSDEGGLIDSEYRNLYVVDRVATTGVTWLGMTVACAQCHDHKYDPITQKDFYRLYAFFNNVPETGKDGVRDRNPKPFLQVLSTAQQEQRQQYSAKVQAAESEFAALTKSLVEKQSIWEKEVSSVVPSAVLTNPDVHFPLDDSGDGVDATGEPIQGERHDGAKFVEGSVGASFQPAGKHWFEYGDRFSFEKTDAFSVGAYLYSSPKGGSPFGKMDDKNSSLGWDVEFHGLRPSVHLIHKWPDDAIHVQADEDLPADTFAHFAFTYDGSGKASGLKLYINGMLAKSTVRKDNLQGSIQSTTPFHIGRRGTLGTPFYGRIDDLKVYRSELLPNEVAVLGAGDSLKIAALPVKDRSKNQKEQLEKFYRQTQAPEWSSLQKSLAELKKTKDDFENALPNTMVMSEMEKPRDTFIKVRGNYDQDGEKVTPAVPAFLPQLAPNADGVQPTRLQLAQWLVSSEHPLTARVMANRWWAMLFGTGIVKTLNDFGSQGERPSHPELLDWLASDLKRDWDIKRAIKQMVLSATYQQTSRVSPALQSKDPENRLLARGPRQRLDAELLRDNALAISGILNPSLGGKSIKPAQPEGTWEINEMSGYKYEKSKGADLYRRGLYVYWRRSTVYPSFVTLDAPTREFCVSQRAKTSTPLQSLVLMNDPVFVEAARALAQRILAQPNLDDSARIVYAWRVALSRAPSQSELSILLATLNKQLKTYRDDKESAKKLASVGDLPKVDSLDESDVAAWTALSNVILNLNETISN